ncbi:MAG TPA: oligopeptide/dipeptide ABC transporter ATP-binding protein [Steroidobacteraceae bacterium]|nr:oligopeptide/dipeptide ABC transporter ATP-binding protein [Steroidobacteraceae bacterium]
MSVGELKVRDLSVHYQVQHGGGHAVLRAAEHVHFDIPPGTTLGVVGESGSGKSSIARALMRLVPAAGGQVLLDGQDLLQLEGAALRTARRKIQMIFQDPVASLDPRMTVEDIIAEPLRSFCPEMDRAQRHAEVLAMMQRVGLAPEHLRCFPHEFSGGQAQRIGIARALVQKPSVVICDEPISALDVSIRAQIANLLRDLQQEFGLTLLFIAHDLATVRYSCDQVLVLYLGRVMELASREQLFANPRHPYTRALLDAAPIPDPVLARSRKAEPLRGEIPSPMNPPSGCVFRTRCPIAEARCAETVPPLIAKRPGHEVACLLD